MAAPIVRDVRAVAIPRLDPEGHGIHLVWSGPDLVPLALNGYEVRRRTFERTKTRRVCVELAGPPLSTLERVGYMPNDLGSILCRPGMWPQVNVGPEPQEPVHPVPAAHPLGQTPLQEPLRSAPEAPAIAASPTIDAARPPDVQPFPAISLKVALPRPPPGLVASVGTDPVLVFTQELAQTSDRISVRCTSKAAFAVALSAGKGVALHPIPTVNAVVLEATAIDTVIVYARAVSHLQICADFPADLATGEQAWVQAEMIASGLTLPLRESDPTLTTRADELARARSRLLPGETLTDAEADSLAEALRAAAGRADLGRQCDRVMLTRTDPGSPFQETLFSSRIALLTLDPKWRRVLGFGFADLKAADGQVYEYRVTGQFEAADLDLAVYDVHTVPSGTTLPMAVRIADLTLNFPAPAVVVLDPPPDSAALNAVSRRAMGLQSATAPLGFLGGDLLFDLACVITLPRPCDAVTLEVAYGHDLRYAGTQDGDPFTPLLEPLPPGPSAVLTFATPVTQIRLAGRGSLYAIRIAGATGAATLSRNCGPVELVAEPLPVAPPALAALNLQTPPALMTGEIGERSQVPARPQPGFTLTWVPSTLSPPGIWPDEIAAGPPLEAVAHEIEHRRVDTGPGGAGWESIHAGDNLTFASWPASSTRPPLGYGVDLADAFPTRQEREPGSPLVMSVTDVFGVVDPETGTKRPPAPLGSVHQYRIRAVDIVGRTSAGWTESNQARLEKHTPPPLPVGPQPPPLPTDGRMSGLVGVRARAILANDPGLSDADRVLLLGHSAAVLLEWGWRDVERELDPATAEFRVYLQQRPPTEVPGLITSVASAPGGWVVHFTTDRLLGADECKGQWLESGGTSFLILGHTAGSAVQITLAADAVAPSTAPVPGAIIFGRPLAPEHQRPSGWQSRVAIVGLSDVDTYRYPIYDAVAVDVTNPRQTVWVGVSAADAEPYITDELPAAAPNGGRSGNESSIASVAVTAVYRGRPTFSMPPPLGDVPEAVSDEPTGRQVSLHLNGSELLSGALDPGSSVALDRCSATAILAITRVDGAGSITMRRGDGSAQAIVFPNAADEGAVATTLAADHPEWLASRYLLYLLSQFDRPDELLKRTASGLQRLDTLTDSVDPSPSRYFYRVRLADARGALSVGGAILPIVARVPSIAPPAPPRRVALVLDGGLALTVDVGPDPDLHWVLLFNHVAPWSASAADASAARLLRMPNRRDLYPSGGIRIRLGSGELVEPVVKSLADPDVVTQPDGSLRLTVTAPLPPPAATPETAQYWCYALSRDGIPSRALGPRSIGLSRHP
jgi:hypothetical protein